MTTLDVDEVRALCERLDENRIKVVDVIEQLCETALDRGVIYVIPMTELSTHF